MSAPLWQPRSDRAARLLGLVALPLGLLLLRWQVLGPFRAADSGAPRIEYSLTLVLFGIV